MMYLRTTLARMRGLFTRSRGRTVRYMFPVVFGVVALLTASTLNSVSYSYIRIQPSQTSLQTGERFSIDVYAYAHEPVNAVDISLEFNPTEVEITGVDTGESVITLWTEQPYVDNNRVYMRGGTFQRGFRGEHRIATINARARQTGSTELLVSSVNLLAGDGRGTPVLTGTPESSRASVYIYDQNSDPGAIGAAATVHVLTDINGDGKVTLSDISSFLAAWHSRSAVYDFNNDGKMTFRDFAIILADSFFGPRPR